jgi:hypothetical protein
LAQARSQQWDYIHSAKGAPMILSFFLARMNRPARFVWSPALDLEDHAIYSTLIPGAQY